MDQAVGDAGRRADPLSWRRPSEWCQTVKDVSYEARVVGSGADSVAVTLELFHDHLARVLNTLAPDYLPGRHGEDLKIDPEGMVGYVPEVEIEFFFPGQGVPTIHLCPARNARQDIMPALLFDCVAIEVLHQQGPGPYQAHVALDDVDQFRQFVKARAPEQLPEPCQPLAVRFRIGRDPGRKLAHGAELIDGERLPLDTRPPLAE